MCNTETSCALPGGITAGAWDWGMGGKRRRQAGGDGWPWHQRVGERGRGRGKRWNLGVALLDLGRRVRDRFLAEGGQAVLERLGDQRAVELRPGRDPDRVDPGSAAAPECGGERRGMLCPELICERGRAVPRVDEDDDLEPRGACHDRAPQRPHPPGPNEANPDRRHVV